MHTNTHMIFKVINAHVMIFSQSGLHPKSMDDLTEMAKQCCAEDVYHFDDIERFFLISCLATW